jgi:group II intron reverse transcriptase/maturase
MKEPLSLEKLSTQLQWIAERAKDKEFKYWTLVHYITPELLHRAFEGLRKGAAPGEDGVTAEEYSKNLSANLAALHTRLKEQKYRASKIKRVWIAKDGKRGEKRPLGLTTVEDKIVQRAVVMLLEGIYERDFHSFSYGYRKGKSCHQALESIWQQVMSGMQWIIDADVSDYFSTISHAQLREFLSRRVEDKGIIRLIGKWLNAGVLEDETLSYPEDGTPQGGVISPLLANIYLHYVLDEWFMEEVKPRLRGRAFIVRVADDFIIGCEYEDDAYRIMEVLPKRMGKHGLTMHPEKTRLLDFRKPKPGASKGSSTFDFLGFRHYWGKSRKGKWVVQRKTMPKRLSRTMRRVHEYCRGERHCSVKEQHRKLCSKLRGHYNYYGITGNYRSLIKVYRWVVRQWRFWLNKRGSKPWSWEKFSATILSNYPLPLPRVVNSVYTTAR